MAANADMNGAEAVGAVRNFQAAIEKERDAVGQWWQNWGFLAKDKGPNPTQLPEYIAALEKKHQEMSEGQAVPGFSTTNDLVGVGEPLDFGPDKKVKNSKDLMATNPYY